MRWITSLYVVVPLLSASIVVTDAVSRSASTHRWLSCGDTRFEITTFHAAGSVRAHQSMYAGHADGSRSRVDLRVSRKPSKLSSTFEFPPTSSVEEWQCLRTKKKTFMELLYVCNGDMSNSDIDQYCKGWAMKEWSRYIGLDGRPLDQGLDVEDPRYHKLEETLGLSDHAGGAPYQESMIPVE